VNKEKHISESQFLAILKKRMNEYFIAITGNKGSASTAMHIKTAQHTNIQRVESQLKKSGLFNGEFWGYGINSICDGFETHSSVDVEDFKKIQDLNKHHNEQRLFWLLTFTTDAESLLVSVFCIDTATFGVNSNLNTKYELKDFKNARIRTRKDRIYVDLIFQNLLNPIHFQIDTYGQGGKLYGEMLAEYYINQIEEKAGNLKANEDIATKSKSIEKDVDDIEIKLRSIFVRVLEKETGRKEYQDILTGKHKSDLRRRIAQHVAKHPMDNVDNYKLLSNAIDFSDIEHLKQSILKEANWHYFEPVFENKEATEKYFDQLSQLRHTLKHSRKMTDLVRLEGEAAIEWFNQILDNSK